MDSKKSNSLLNAFDATILNPTLSPLLNVDRPLCGFLPSDFWQSMEYARDPTKNDFSTNIDIQIIEANFKRFCQQVKDEPCTDFSKVPINCRIPAILHFIWLGSPLPHDAEIIIQTWIKCHPGWEIKIWTDESVKDVIWTNGYIKLAFEDARTWAEKADILRYEILYRFGGIYSDIDALCYRSFNDLICRDITLFTGLVENIFFLENEGELHIANGLVGVVKEHPAIKYCLEHLITEDEAPTETISTRTGPALFARACHEELHSTRADQILVLPCSYFYSLPYFHFWKNKQITAKQIVEKYLSPESLSLHLWANTWAL